ncbi:MAG: hypothetical protein Salg2KO_11090 [Salibacteraceae bacterium]
MYNPDDSIEQYEFDAFAGTEEITIGAEYTIADSLIHPFTLQSDPAKDNKTIHAVYVGEIANIATDTVILYCHGNAGHLDYYWSRVKLLANAGGKNRYGVMAMDYRGFGLSEGSPTEKGLYEDVDACMRWLKQMGLTSDRLIIYGFSLGSAPATELTAKPRTLQPSKLMLEAPFASDEVMVEDGSGLSLPGSFFSDLEINNADEIKRVEEPFFWIHGTADKFLNMSTHGETVYANYNGSYSEAHRVKGGAHSDVPEVMGYPEYVDAVYQFIVRP